MQNVLIATLAFVLMEPFTYCAHRWVMHGLAKFLHESHHRNAARAVPALLEAKDVKVDYPVQLPGWRGWFKKGSFTAVHHASFSIARGRT